MRKILLIIVLVVGVLSCGMPKEVQYPNKNLKIENNVVYYKGEKYYGKLKGSIKKANIETELNIKNGKLDGRGFYKEGDLILLEYSLVDRKDGEFIIDFHNSEYSSKSTFEYKNGKIQKFYDDNNIISNEYSFDNEGRATGKDVEMETGEIIAYKDGVGERPDLNESYKKYINKDGNLTSEAYKNGVLYNIDTTDFYDIDKMDELIFNKLK